MEKYLYIAVGGGLGAIARYWMGEVMAGRFGTRFPYGTFVINLSACVLLGFSLAVLTRHLAVNPAWIYLIPTGFVGAYSTFSTFEWETFIHLQAGQIALAGAYVGLSIVLGLAGVGCGVWVARLVS